MTTQAGHNIWADFPQKSLPEVLSFIVDNRGKTVPTSEFGWKLIATNCIRNENLYPSYEKIRFLSEETYRTWFRAHPTPGDIIFVCKGTPGRVCMVPDPIDFCIAQDMVALRVNDKIMYNRFLLVVLRSQEIQKQINNYSVGDVIPHFKKSFFDRLMIPVPPMSIQKAIGDFYFSFALKIELNTQINHNLEEQAKAIFKSWFVDFEPFQNGKFVDSELGPIPDGWSCISFEDFLQPRNEKSNDNTLQMYAVTDHGIIKRENKFHKKLSKSETKNKVLYAGDLVFGMSREILNWGIMHDAVGGVSSAYNIYEITNGIDPLFIEFYMHSNQVYFKDLIRPATREGQGVDKGALVRKKLIYPPVHIWNNIKQMLSSFAEKNESTNNEITDLIELRDTLLPKLMSGEIDVSEVEV